MSIANKIAKNFFISAFARIIGLILALFIAGLMTRYLGKEGFGYYATSMAFVFIFSIFSDLGIYSIVTRDISRPGANEGQLISHAFSLRFFWAALMFTVCSVVVWLFPYPEIVKKAVLIQAVGFWFLSLSQVLMGVLQKYLRTDKSALADVASRILQLALVAILIYKDAGFLWIVSAMAAGSALNALIIYIGAKQHIKFSVRVSLSAWKNLLYASYPLAISGILTVIYFKMDTIMLSLFKPAEDVGIYGLSYKVLESVIVFPSILIGLVLPQLSFYVNTNKDRFKLIAQKTLDVLLIGVVPLVLGTIFLSTKIVTILGGLDFISASKPLNILIIATAFIFLGAFYSNILIVINKQKLLALIYGAGAVFNVVANYFLIPRYSYMGAASTTLATELLVTILMIIASAKYLHYNFSFSRVWKYLISAVAMSVVLLMLGNLNIAILLPLGMVIYFVVLFIIRGFNRQDIKILTQRDAN